MPLFTPWESSPELTAAKKMVNDTAGRIATVRSDIARIKPKLSTYKKETLEKLVRENNAKLAAAYAANMVLVDYSKQPESVYLGKLETALKKLIKKTEDSIKARIAEIKKEAAAQEKAALAFMHDGGGKGGGSRAITVRLYDEYKHLAAALEKELGVASKEKPPNAARTV